MPHSRISKLACESIGSITLPAALCILRPDACSFHLPAALYLLRAVRDVLITYSLRPHSTSLPPSASSGRYGTYRTSSCSSYPVLSNISSFT